jgi:adenylate cyclase
MSLRCLACGAALPGEARFCMECGARVEVEAPPPIEVDIPPELRAKFESVRADLHGDRRQVVVLFADLKGFTSLAEQLDPEEVTLLVGSVLQDLAAAVYEYEGYVDKFIGDAIMALFGAPLAHEDDPERAVLAGLAMQERIARRNAAGGPPLGLRVGIHAGEVVAAHLGDGLRLQYTVVGDAVNVASRLEGQAELNTVLVSDAVHSRVASRFEAVPLPPLTVKGRKEPLATFRIVGVREGPRAIRAATPFVGRQDELARLETFLARGSGVAIIEAEAGSGKSRLAREAIDRAKGPTRVVELGFSAVRRPGERSAPAELFRRLVSGVEEAVALAGEEHRAGIVDVEDEAGDAGRESDVDPATARERRRLALAALLRAAAREQPIILLVEDLHWADEDAHDFFAFLLSAVAEAPVATLVTARPGVVDWLPGEPLRIALAPLDEKAAGTLLGGVLEVVPPPQRRELLRRAAGNPLFLEELALAFRQGATVGTVPDTLQGLIRARIDRLDSDPRSALQMASVLGTRFPLKLLERMYGLESHPTRFDQAVAALESGGFLLHLDGERSFAHDLLQEVAYSGLLMRIRKVLHESAARLGEELFGDQLEAEAPFLAHHWWEAGMRAEALPHLWIAGRAASARYDLIAAERYLRRAGDTLETHPFDDAEERARFSETLGKVLLWRGDLDQADLWFERLEREGLEAGRAAWRARALDLRGRVAWHHGRLDDAKALFEAGLAAAPPVEPSLAADLHNALGIVHYYRSRPDDAFAHHEEALRLRERLDDRLGLAKSHSNIGNLLLRFRGDHAGAEARYLKALELAEEVGDRQMAVSALHNLGGVAIERGAWAEALERYRQVEALHEEIGWSHLQWVTCLDEARCEIGLGRIGDAITRLGACMRDGDPILEPVNRVNVRLYFFDAWLAQREVERARTALADAQRLVTELEVSELLDEVRLREGRLAAAEERWAEAARIFGDAEAAARQLGNRDLEALAGAHQRRAEARAGAIPAKATAGPDSVSVGSPQFEHATATELLVAYLEADAESVTGASEATARRLAGLAERAAQLGWPALEAAAIERLTQIQALSS